jgi:hypothetical protein
MLGARLEVEVWQKRTPVWRTRRSQVKMHKAHHARNAFTPLWRETDFEVKRVKSWRFRNTFFKIQMSKT